MTPREELIEIISKTKLPDGCPLGKSFVLVNDEELEIASVLADAIIAAGYRKVEAGRDARETASEVFAEICAGNCIQEPCLIAPCHCRNAIVTAITAAVEAQRERDAQIAVEYGCDDARQHASRATQFNTANAIAAAIREG